ncbi:hypothetical protein D9Q98_000060 [Chlorella vulgaris]|uniref:Sulfotransferase n=1 Tax=Chlorella vulgaris TaxID=3077 RepID=A0A9D4TXI8_CHLVU|nr:hypothetical protein D9Q98_000060 [Chlorella vulgaris]
MARSWQRAEPRVTHPCRPGSRTVTGLLALIALMAVWRAGMQRQISLDSRSSLVQAEPGCRNATYGQQMLMGGQAGPLGSRSGGAAEVEKGLERRQCPQRVPGTHTSVAFLHVPKTAGQFLARVMKQAMPAEGRDRFCAVGKDYSGFLITPCIKDSGPNKQQFELLGDLQRRFTTECAGFHVHQDYGFMQALHVDHSRTLTVVSLRHPVERATSHYYYHMRKLRDSPNSHNLSSTFAYWPHNDTDFSGLIGYASQRRGQANIHTRQLGGGFGCQWPGGWAAARSAEQVLERAKRTLESFCVIIINELMEESLQLLGAAAGWPESVLFSNRTLENATPRARRVPLEVKRQLEAINHLDMQLYAYALQLFLRHSSINAAAKLGMADGAA